MWTIVSPPLHYTSVDLNVTLHRQSDALAEEGASVAGLLYDSTNNRNKLHCEPFVGVADYQLYKACGLT